MVVALELVEGLLLVSAHHVGDVLFGMDVADARLRPPGSELIADRLDEMRLAEPHPAVDEERVVRDAGILGHLDRRGARKLICLPGHEAVEGKAAVEARALLHDGFWRGARRGGGRTQARFPAAGKHQAQAQFAAARFGHQAFDARREALAHELQNEAVRCGENQRVFGCAGLGRQGPNPGIELLRGQLLLKTTQAGVPEVLHLLVGLKRIGILPWLRQVIHSARRMFFRFDNAFSSTL